MADKANPAPDPSKSEDTPPQPEGSREEHPREADQVRQIQGREFLQYVEFLALVAILLVFVYNSMSFSIPLEKKEVSRGVDSSFLDLAIAIDTTGSMGSYISSARENIRSIVNDIIASQKKQVRLALVEYRDHPPQDSTFVTRTHDFTTSAAAMHGWLSNCNAAGGGDTPEAVADAMFDLTKLSWRSDATKIAILVSDAPPHGFMEHGDSFPNGSPAGHDPIKVARRLGMMNVTMYVIGCEPSLSPYKEMFSALSFLTGGQYFPLRNARQLSNVVIGGAQEKITLQPFIEEAQKEVRRQYAERGADLDVEEMAKELHQRLHTQGATSKRIVFRDDELGVSEQAKAYARMDFTTLRKTFAPAEAAEEDGARMEEHEAADAFRVEESEVTFKQSLRLIREAMTRDEL